MPTTSDYLSNSPEFGAETVPTGIGQPSGQQLYGVEYYGTQQPAQPTQPQTQQMPQTNAQNAGTDSLDPISGIIQTGVNTGAIIGEYWMAQRQMQKIDQYRKEDQDRYDSEYADAMRQQGLNNIYRDKAFDFQVGQFNWGKKQWGKQFAFTKQQYEDSKQQYADQMRRSGFDRMIADMNILAARDQNVKNEVLNRFGV